ncbi:hypothetical protein FRC0433_01931 [Corynebacterium diphtheriae]|nr:hypothetical protein FRC0433_01931 [Corynebacterium diphtheriae]
MTSTLPTLRQTDGTLRPQSPEQPTKHHTPKRRRYADRILEGLTRGSAITIITVVIAIGAFLLWRAIPAISNHPGGLLGFLTYAGNWNVATTSAMLFGIPNLLATTVLISALALMVAMPVALGVSIFLNFYSPRMLRTPLGFLVDMVAAVPSIVFGLWGWQVLGPALSGVYEWLARVTNGFFLFHVYPNSPAFATGRNILTGAVVLSVMILPVIAATTREVLAAVRALPRRGSARTRGNKSRDDPHGSAALWPQRFHRRLHAGTWPRTRRNDGYLPHCFPILAVPLLVFRRRHHLRNRNRECRAGVQRRPARRGIHRRRPRAVHCHLCGQFAGALDRPEVFSLERALL